MADDNHWQLIAADEFCCPAAPTVTRFQQAWQRVLRILGLRSKDAVEQGDDIRLPGYREFDRTPAVTALGEDLAGWIEGNEHSVCFLLDPPFSGSAAIVRDWAWQQGWVMLTPPDIELVRAVRVEEWWQQQKLIGGPWVIDDLARYLLRSADGLRFIRALLPRLLHGEFGQGLVVCDSWTFAFLRRTWPLGLPRVYCFAPAETDLLRQVGIKGSDRQLHRLAARARGNVGLALALWACRLNEDRALPELPLEADDSTAFVLYSLLLHRGLSGEGLQLVLPVVVPDQLNVQLLRLEQFGIIERERECWRLSVYGYLAVRDFLGGRDYLLDDF
ncbi:hypothetical protein [Zobellella maritima]|uniref:hypothetical protein n=1 Tax=Zobellella maritima TaxID=2059725 RepID=UPI000E3082CE|nr:hypothetical protein [Zobellella maritima]